MNNFAKISICLLFYSLYILPVGATQTLDCSTNDYLVRMHVNSEGHIADITIYLSESEHYSPSISELDMLKINWNDKNNSLHIKKEKKTSSSPAFELQTNKENGIFTIKGKTEPCKCEWGD